MTLDRTQPRQRRMRLTALLGAATVAAMVGVAFAAVPLYDAFCRVTGFGGTTQVAEAAPQRTGERVITVRFDASTARGLPWRFQPAQRQVSLRTGEEVLAFYTASNPADRPVTGTATFNVTPLKAGQYFNKVECFCFTEQELAPGQSVEMPVSFFIDPAIEDNPNLREVTTITLSYTFFETEKSAAMAATGRGDDG
jgi:cytochrome c oxidase assembly protein subunit 11